MLSAFSDHGFLPVPVSPALFLSRIPAPVRSLVAFGAIAYLSTYTSADYELACLFLDSPAGVRLSREVAAALSRGMAPLVAVEVAFGYAMRRPAPVRLVRAAGVRVSKYSAAVYCRLPIEVSAYRRRRYGRAV